MAANKSNSMPRNVLDNTKPPQPKIIIPVKDYQDKEASEDSKLKAIWDEQISSKNASVAYHKAHVLLLSWHQDDDDLNVEQEVKDLKDVFQNTFKYQTTRKILKQDPEKHPQTQINMYLSDFVYNHDGPNTLLIVYYAGHGKLGDDGKGLALTGSTTIPDEDNELHEIVWSSAEHNIQKTKSDVLVIFDCCNAGEMDRGVRGTDFTRRAFEYMAATSQRSTTKRPGPNSFTAALIWALKEMVRLKPGKRFSTHELLRKIYCAPKFPEAQAPRLTERGPIGSLRKIVLVPLDQQRKFGSSEQKSMEIMDEIRETLSLRFVFNGKITKKMVRELAKDMAHLISEGDFVASTVLWEGRNTSSSTTRKFQAVVSHVIGQNHARKQSAASISSVECPQLSPATPTEFREPSMSPEESVIGPDQLLPSSAPEIAMHVGGSSFKNEVLKIPKKRKRDEWSIRSSETIDATKSLGSSEREKRLKRRQSGDRKIT